jgi:hypothetical protein
MTAFISSFHRRYISGREVGNKLTAFVPNETTVVPSSNVEHGRFG